MSCQLLCSTRVLFVCIVRLARRQGLARMYSFIYFVYIFELVQSFGGTKVPSGMSILISLPTAGDDCIER